MPSSWLDHRKLQIVKGIGKVPGDTNSAEPDPVIVNLMSGPITLEPNGWSPQIAPSDTVWADSPLVDGRTLLMASAKNVTEKMSVLIADNSSLGMIKALDGLNKMVADCRDFWQSQVQIDPVYLLWYAGCGAGEQYALISNIDVAADYLDSPTPSIRVSLSIEREPYWRGIPPGANPKLWTLGTLFNSASANLMTGTDHLVTKTIQNTREWNTTQTAELTNNYVDIPAASIPGDAPALVCIATDSQNGDLANVMYVGRSTKPTTVRTPSGTNMIPILTLNAGDASLGGGSSVAADTGAPRSNSAAAGRRVDMNGSSLIWWDNTAPTLSKIDMNAQRGTYACFMRARVSAAANYSVALSYGPGTAFQSMPAVTVSSLGAGGVGNTTSWLSYYMGVMSLPLNNTRVPATLTGLGESVATASLDSLEIDLTATLNSGAGHLYIADIIMIPIDECAFSVANGSASPGIGSRVTIDSTGYVNRGSLDVGVINSGLTLFVDQRASIYSGQVMSLLPKVNNRLLFYGSYDGATFNTATVWDVKINIVPRWAGIRDV